MALTKITSKATTTISAGGTIFNNVIDDLASTSNAKGASCIGVEDSAGNMDAANVEAALAEIYSDHSSTRTLAEIFDENSATTTGLTWGYKAGTIRIDNTVTSISAGTLSLTDDATNYVEISSAGVVLRNTTGFTSGRIPIRQIICASGVQTTSTDKRAWFTQVAAETGATTAVAGIIEIATNAEAVAGTETALAIVPSSLKAMLGDLTDHSLLVGSGAAAVTALGAATHGQLPIGSTGADPVLAALTAGAKIAITNAAGSITVATTGAAASGANLDITSLIFLPAGTIMLFGQSSAPTGWTRKADWADNAMLCYAASGDIASGGAVNPQTAHTHTGPSHTHTGPSHTHPQAAHQHFFGGTSQGANTGSWGTDVIIYHDSDRVLRDAKTSPVGGETCYLLDASTQTDGATTTGAGGTGATGAEGTGATGSNTQPYYQEVIAATKD